MWQAERVGLSNFSLLTAHVLVPPALGGILGSPRPAVARREPEMEGGERGLGQQHGHHQPGSDPHQPRRLGGHQR